MEGEIVNTSQSPFLAIGQTGPATLPPWVVKKYLQSAPNIDLYRPHFIALVPENGLVTGATIKPHFVKISGLPSTVLHRYARIHIQYI